MRHYMYFDLLMKVNRKTFLKQLGLVSTGLIAPHWLKANKNERPFLFESNDYSSDAAYWANIRKLYPISKEVINLNNAAVSPQALPVQAAFVKKHEYSNTAPSYAMWEKLNEQREPLRHQLANMLGCTANEIALCRNTTEGLNQIIFGINLSAGDEVVLSNMDYPFAMNAWKQREERDKIKLSWVTLNAPEESEAAIIAKFDKAIGPKTKIVHLTYVINWNGQVLPVKKLTRLAHSKGCKVVIDGAHAFGQLDHNMSDLDADFYATSLHKWIGAPFGTGVFYMKAQLISSIWPLHAAYQPKSSDIRKFEMLGTRSFATEMAVADALNFHQQIGREKMYCRLIELKNYWVDKIKNLPKITLYSPVNNDLSCGFATFGIEGYLPQDIVKIFLKENNIHVSPVNLVNIKGVRVSPHIYNLTDELDTMIKLITKLTGK